jgi:hypothetical protein
LTVTVMRTATGSKNSLNPVVAVEQEGHTTCNVASCKLVKHEQGRTTTHTKYNNSISHLALSSLFNHAASLLSHNLPYFALVSALQPRSMNSHRIVALMDLKQVLFAGAEQYNTSTHSVMCLESVDDIQRRR